MGKGKMVKWQGSPGMSRFPDSQGIITDSGITIKMGELRKFIKDNAILEADLFGEAGSHIQHNETIKITIAEIKEIIKENDIKPDKLFSKEEIAADPKVKEKVEELIKADVEKIKKEENELIPGDEPIKLTPEEKKQQAIDNEFIPDDGKPGSDNELIPD